MAPAKHPQPDAATLPPPAVGEVHLWSVDLDRVDTDLDVLDAEEAARTARFLALPHRRRFAAGRATLRVILGRYLGIDPREVRFAYGPHGRPTVPGAGFDFNLSHAENAGLLAVAGDRVGVDVERRDREADLAGLARQVMTAGELSAFRSLPPEAARDAFYDLWTRKEAVMKLLGTGFSRDPRSLDLGWGDRPTWSEGALQVTLQRLDAAPGLAACLASVRPVEALAWMR